MVVAKSLHPSSGSDGWCTPAALAGLLGDFDLDPCGNARSHVLAVRQCALDHEDERYRDGLAFDWRSKSGQGLSVFVNPPYSNVMPWALKLVAHQGPWVALLKLDSTTKWWAHLMTAMPTVAPFRKRIAFESDNGGTMTANFASVLIWSAWRPPVDLVPHLWLPRY